MTVGKDVSMLFPDVVNCMQTEDLELKKLVYLYLINYAKTQPDLAIMAVNTFVKVGICDEVGFSDRNNVLTLAVLLR
jgi:AP-1 complex subunit beta-1